jgi:hypothetical protein
MAGLPADSLYRQTERVSLMATIIELWQRSRRRSKMPVAADKSSTSVQPNTADEARNAA